MGPDKAKALVALDFCLNAWQRQQQAREVGGDNTRRIANSAAEALEIAREKLLGNRRESLG